MSYVCGVDMAFRGEHRYAMDPMGLYETVEDAVLRCSQIHRSFGYEIYEVESGVTSGLTRVFGIRAGTKGPGYRVIRRVCLAFEHAAWPDGRRR